MHRGSRQQLARLTFQKRWTSTASDRELGTDSSVMKTTTISFALSAKHISLGARRSRREDVFTNPRRSERGPDSPSRKLVRHDHSDLRPNHSSLARALFNPRDGIRAELIGRRRAKNCSGREISRRHADSLDLSESRRTPAVGVANDLNQMEKRGGYKSSSARGAQRDYYCRQKHAVLEGLPNQLPRPRIRAK